jgi:hypothetical protein
MMDYLVYVAHDAENLQFYLWFKDYTKRFGELNRDEQALSPEWKTETANPFGDDEPITHKKNRSEFDIEKMQKPSYASIRMSELTTSGSDGSTVSDYQSFLSKSANNSRKTVGESAEDASRSAGLKWQPCKLFVSEYHSKTNVV